MWAEGLCEQEGVGAVMHPHYVWVVPPLVVQAKGLIQRRWCARLGGGVPMLYRSVNKEATIFFGESPMFIGIRGK